MTLAAGTRLGPYEILAPLGAGVPGLAMRGHSGLAHFAALAAEVWDVRLASFYVRGQL